MIFTIFGSFRNPFLNKKLEYFAEERSRVGDSFDIDRIGAVHTSGEVRAGSGELCEITPNAAALVSGDYDINTTRKLRTFLTW